jgi:hypothetical protein
MLLYRNFKPNYSTHTIFVALLHFLEKREKKHIEKMEQALEAVVTYCREKLFLTEQKLANKDPNSIVGVPIPLPCGNTLTLTLEQATNLLEALKERVETKLATRSPPAPPCAVLPETIINQGWQVLQTLWERMKPPSGHLGIANAEDRELMTKPNPTFTQFREFKVYQQSYLEQLAGAKMIYLDGLSQPPVCIAGLPKWMQEALTQAWNMHHKDLILMYLQARIWGVTQSVYTTQSIARSIEENKDYMTKQTRNQTPRGEAKEEGRNADKRPRASNKDGPH